jgi:hypothetical protein
LLNFKFNILFPNFFQEDEEETPRSRAGDASDLAPVRGLVTGLSDALRLTDRALREHDDTANISDAIVHVILQVCCVVCRVYGWVSLPFF